MDFIYAGQDNLSESGFTPFTLLDTLLPFVVDGGTGIWSKATNFGLASKSTVSFLIGRLTSTDPNTGKNNWPWGDRQQKAFSLDRTDFDFAKVNRSYSPLYLPEINVGDKKEAVLRYPRSNCDYCSGPCEAHVGILREDNREVVTATNGDKSVNDPTCNIPGRAKYNRITDVA